MSILPLQYGFASKRWTKAIQIMLKKKPGMPLVNRLKGIIILKANYNWVLCTIWGKRLFQNATEMKTLMTAQQAQPENQSITAVLNKILPYDLLQLTRQSGGSLDNDVKGCYNRIVHPHAMMCYRRMGLPKSAATMFTTILQNTIYKLKMGHGISAKIYMSTQIK